jgi:hypothetical protein
VGIVAAVTTGYGWRVLKKSSEFLIAPIKKADDEEEEPVRVASGLDKSGKQKELLKIDKQFDSLKQKLEKLCTG